jgi:hypothetical protein
MQMIVERNKIKQQGPVRPVGGDRKGFVLVTKHLCRSRQNPGVVRQGPLPRKHERKEKCVYAKTRLDRRGEPPKKKQGDRPIP